MDEQLRLEFSDFDMDEHPIRTARDFLRELLIIGSRESTYYYDDGRFVIYGLDKWDDLCKRVERESN